MAGEKTEAPTPRKLQKARSQGQVSRSADLSAAVLLLVGLGFFRIFGSYLWNTLRDGMRGSFQQIASPDQITQEAITAGGMDTMLFVARILAPMLGTLVIAAIAVSVLQTGPLLSAHPLRPKAQHVNPIAGAKRIFSAQGLATLGKSLLKLVIVGVVVSLTIWSRTDELMAMTLMSVPSALETTVSIAFDVVWKASLALFLMGVADFAFQRWQFSRNMRMTKDEVKDETKQTEGNPEVKGRIRKQRATILHRTIQATARADVVVTNPIHYAVALKYDPLTMAAPVVLAKGERLVAQRMKEVAAEHRIPVVENKPLARSLFKEVPVGREVPPTLYQAVAEVLAFVYRMRNPAGAPPAA